VVQPVHRLVSVGVGVPVDEGNVFGGDLDITGPRLDQPSGEQASLAKPARVVAIKALLGLPRDVESLTVRGAQQAVGVLQ
jgi:hypothetical protein